MNIKKIILILFFLIVGFATYKYTYGLFTSAASNDNNSLTASNAFPTATPTNTPTPTVTQTPTPTPQLVNHVVISEVQIDGGTGDANKNDFIELYNPTSSSIPLNGLRLIKRTASSGNDTTIYNFTSSHNINAHGYFLWGHKSSNNNFADIIFADVSSADTLAVNNSIALKNVATGAIVDALSWDSSSLSLKEETEFSPNPSANQSAERKANSTSTVSSMNSGGVDEFKGNGYDSDNNSTDFILRTLSQPQYSTSSAEIP
ncbi:hypothetical protein A3A46_03455 [Candidatus Roizmanbacteria bacterium RIFCSPLOWO2_01_FULL_37_13]|uniref:LTD domain-containing protein n=1 Tax=Candidatus Roizmanbacteria bacterium RIFCSPHIGHO2_02_FULL_38_11 TaxID=1802039 RepID=A0A1F7GX60_9BACT|nr:MAG: hypothetical protein A3C25_02290 [Candidatus Roizmanbacteria bacterium RIFCSPHIGHO2_02_FULL_38_11]OGK35228.1 MAG: hypothetical protein A3F58_00470 [Candidatus Roizmanbacteria bacterium RIFCSPHIGHO2_12_FULL_37_9b]OGK43183.1 MAG: hypothetical protein A3A46_03455 [Candidatus Roizmanbacteria bacterium RIFCSPLOWO2_01_FULL_37_13]